MNKLFILLLFSILISCSSLKEADKVLRNEKIRTTDEFLVKKRDPLIYPPNYEEVPEPGSKNENQSDHGIRQASANRYDTTYRLRIAKYMDHNVLLSEFGNKHMKEFLIAACDDGVPYKSLINAVKDIKYFLLSLIHI